MGTFDHFRLGLFAWKLSFGMLRLGTFAWTLSFGTFRLGTFVWELWLRCFRLGMFAQERREWGNRLASLGWECGWVATGGMSWAGDLDFVL